MAAAVATGAAWAAARSVPHRRGAAEAEATARGGSTEAELRSTYVDAEEAAMMRSLARINGGDAMKAAGNSYRSATAAAQGGWTR